MAWQNNTAELRGRLGGEPSISHISRDVTYYQAPILTRRLSGAVDQVNAILPRSLLPALPGAGERVWLRGELRSYNNRSGSGNRLLLYLFVQELAPAEEEGEDRNEAQLVGVVCKAPVWRKTPMGREICDLMLAVNRRYGRADYLPCIAWGKNAELAANWQQGQTVALQGRFQSRVYVKALEGGGSVEKTAYEVSVTVFLPSAPED